MAMMYGHNLESLDDPFIVAADENATMAFRLLQPGFTLISVFHFLQYIPPWSPGAIAQRMAKETKRLTDMLRLNPLESVKKQPCESAYYIFREYASDKSNPLNRKMALRHHLFLLNTWIVVTEDL